MALEIPNDFGKPENCFIIRIVKNESLVPKYLYYVFQNMYLNLKVFENYKKLTISDLRNIPIQATKGYNTELAETKETEERLGDLVKILEGTEPLQNEDVIIITKGSDIGKTIILEDKQ